MTRLRSFFEADTIEKFGNATANKTSVNTNDVFCEMCGGKFFVDDAQAEHIAEALRMSSESSFLCEGCVSEYEEMSHRK